MGRNNLLSVFNNFSNLISRRIFTVYAIGTTGMFVGGLYEIELILSGAVKVALHKLNECARTLSLSLCIFHIRLIR